MNNYFSIDTNDQPLKRLIYHFKFETVVDYFMRNYPLNEDNEPMSMIDLTILYLEDFDLLDEYKKENIEYEIRNGSVYVYEILP